MTIDDSRIDQLLAAALRAEGPHWPRGWCERHETAQVTDRIAYHGIAGLIAERAWQLNGWPDAVLLPVREQAIALAMWEMRHKALLSDLLTALADAGIVALLLKGTALAYDLYPVPATRARGDSDLLVGPSDLAAARSTLARLGYRCEPLDQSVADDLSLQEVWRLTCDAGTTHHIDLHWQLLNAPALRGVLEFGECSTDPLPLPQLSLDALAMSRALTLIHTCVHRAMHLTSPYFVDGVTYYGGDRLIWAKDIDLLAGALSDREWRRFGDVALGQGVAAACLDGLDMARRSLGTAIPQAVLDTLEAGHAEPASAYLLGAGQAGRAWSDLKAIRGWRRKLAYAGARSLPSPAFMRGKYPELAKRPLALLYLRRLVDLVRPRSSQGGRR